MLNLHLLFFLYLLQMDIQQVALYCDPALADQETCCEIPGAKVRVATLLLNTFD